MVKMDSLFQEEFKKKIVPKMMKDFGWKNPLEVPRFVKIVVNAGVGKFRKEGEKVKAVEEDLARIFGQKPLKTYSKKAISGFSIRKGDLNGFKITIRGKRMYDLIYKFINIIFPRMRDFQGISPRSIDEQGNLTIGIEEQIAFPEMAGREIKHLFGLEVTFVTSAKSRQRALQLFKAAGFPLREEEILRR